MNKWLKIFIGLAIIGIIAAILGYQFIYNKPHRDFEKASPDFSLTAKELFSEFRNNRQEAEQTYNGKVLMVSGNLSKVEVPDSLTIAVFVMEEGLFGDEGIRCTMLPNHANKLTTYINNRIELKGYCTGFNDIDVILEKCSIVE